MPEIGQKLSHYTIVEKIGKGGMGEVFRAKDQKLGRDVAIKVLPEEFARDTDRVERFQREAKLLASLNHQNIAAIYGLEESSGTKGDRTTENQHRPELAGGAETTGAGKVIMTC